MMDKYQVLKHYFGHENFRDGQEELIDSILSGKDVFGIMPTGSGKSLCYQIPALIKEGVTIVVSPLISLMQDQVKALNMMGIHAAYLNSSLSHKQYEKALQLAKNGQYKIVYVAPERLLTQSFIDLAVTLDISLLSVDEAHCISQWGQDFRPSYLKIYNFIESLPSRPVVSAFTATATKTVQKDIVKLLGLRNPIIVRTGYDRPNLYLEVQSPKSKDEALKNYVSFHKDQSGIVYCLTRKDVEEVHRKLERAGFSVTRYHAGLCDDERRKNQEDFIYDRVQIMVATNAFGMGIDKSDVRFVVHYGMPNSIEAYYQEIGRCARDGGRGECILYYSEQDRKTNKFLIDKDNGNQELDEKTKQIIKRCDRERLTKMYYFCKTTECLREYILRYFGETGSSNCGNCSNCKTTFNIEDVTSIAISIVGCVKDCGQRFGIKIILDTLHGSYTSKVQQYKMYESSYFGEQKRTPVAKLKSVVDYLVVKGYLTITNDKFPVVHLTDKSEDVIKHKEAVYIKVPKNTEGQIKRSPGKSKENIIGAISGIEEKDASLFNDLKVLRTKIAARKGIPAYMVFSDETLKQMCRLRPQDADEMLSINGVGEYKFEQFGDKFLHCIIEHENDLPK